jgi:membrane protease YdiL (CAAX protease family)
MLVTLAAFTAAGAWRERCAAGAIVDRRSAMEAIVLVSALIAATALLSLDESANQEAAGSDASYSAKSSMIQLAINAAIAAPFVAWIVWHRKGTGAIGIGSQDLLSSICIGAFVSLACIVMLGKLSVSFWASEGTLWLMLAMLGVGASEELIFRGFVLSYLKKRLPRSSAEVCSAAIFSVVHLPHRFRGGLSSMEIAVSLLLLFIWGWCFAAAMRKGKNVPGLALVHATVNVCLKS